MGHSLPRLVAIVPARAVCYVSFVPQLALVGVVASGWPLFVLAASCVMECFRDSFAVLLSFAGTVCICAM